MTSPPYLDITNFEEDQWLRLWFLGGSAHPAPGRYSREDRHGTADLYWRLIADMWRSLGQVLDDGAHVVMRVGGKGLSPAQIASGIEGTSVFSQRTVRLISHEVTPTKNQQTRSFRPGNVGIAAEVDCLPKVS